MSTSSVPPSDLSDSIGSEPLNPYAAPATALPEEDPGVAQQLLYVVAPRKFLLLMILTLGAYSLYWFYRNWSLLNRRDRAYWPIPRAIFSIFFTHSLFAEADSQLRRREAVYEWSHAALATLFVVATIASRVFDRLTADHEDSPVVMVISMLFLLPMVWPLYRAQLAINVSQGDTAGVTNAELTAANIVWMVLGGAVWALVLLGLLVTLLPVETLLG